MRRIYIAMMMVLACPLFAAAQTNEKIDTYLKSIVEQGGFSGTVLVEQDGKVVHHKSYGEADKNLAVANTNKSKYLIGTLGQIMVFDAAERLYQQGQFDITTPVEKYLPGLPGGIGSSVMVKQLMEQTSGLSDFLMAPGFLDRQSCGDLTVDGFITEFLKAGDKSGNFAPSNTNAFLLGLVLEKATGKPFGLLMEDLLFDPLGLENTGVQKNGGIVVGLTEGYQINADGYVYETRTLNMDIFEAVGGIYATAEDVAKWMSKNEALKAGKGMDENTASGAPAGFTHRNTGTDNYLSATGFFPGFRSVFDVYQKGGLKIVVLSNYEYAPIERLRADLAAIVLNKPYWNETPTVAAVSKADASPYMGKYELNLAGQPVQVQVELTSDRLVVKVSKDNTLALMPCGADLFRISGAQENKYDSVTFTRGTDDAVNGMIAIVKGNRLVAKKL